MLSICIPHYNFVNPLLFIELERQCQILKIEFEIVIADDASDTENKYYLQDFTQNNNFKVIYIKENIGRSKTRNILIKNSLYSLLLFLDCDSLIKSEYFIKKYLDAIKNNDVVFGGRVYEDLQSNHYKLHWLYGTTTESIAGKNFHSNNFLVKRRVVDTILFDEDLTRYGYEDVVFGAMVALKGFKILKIDNPVIHIQLKDNQQFLNDTDSALKNISYLYRNKPELLPYLNLSILNFYLVIRRFKLHYLLNLTESFTLNKIHKNLISNKSLFPLKVLMLYKLYILNRKIVADYK